MSLVRPTGKEAQDDPANSVAGAQPEPKPQSQGQQAGAKDEETMSKGQHNPREHQSATAKRDAPSSLTSALANITYAKSCL